VTIRTSQEGSSALSGTYSGQTSEMVSRAVSDDSEDSDGGIKLSRRDRMELKKRIAKSREGLKMTPK